MENFRFLYKGTSKRPGGNRFNIKISVEEECYNVSWGQMSKLALVTENKDDYGP